MSQKTRKQGRRVFLPLMGLITLLFFLSTGSRGFLQQIKVRRQKARLKQEIIYLRKQIEELEKEKKKLLDPAEIERIAREEYGMARENEKVYRVVPKEE